MSLSIGIVGLPNVGKSTLFQSITKKQVSRENYPFCTIDPNIGAVTVPDDRVDKLAQLCNSEKKIYTTIEFVDIAGLVEKANQGEGLGNKFLAHIREVDAIIYVLRAFVNDEIINTRNKINVLEEKEILDTEMILKDISTVEKRIMGLEKDVKAGDKTAKKELNVLKKANNILCQGKILQEQDWEQEERKILKNYQLLSFKPRIFLINAKKQEVENDTVSVFKQNNWVFLIIDLLEQFEVSEFSEKEKKELGMSSLGLDSLIKESYKLLDLITFFTTIKSDEVRAWTIKNGSTVVMAGGVVHTDFEKYFIKAEVISCQDLLGAGSFVNAKEKGLIRIEGKEYIVADADVIKIKSRG
ncbi:MAG: redox-regulated ATPase YchF [Candidatus Pacebacteria bacterium]|nr:redox-regulated ATPase YchF [Candidatus Paceibacterota bacterium]